MKTLLILSLLGVLICVLVQEGFAVHKKRKMLNPQVVKMKRSSANTVIKRHKRAYDYYERFYPRIKSTREVKKEQCENYWPCDQLSEWVGFSQAYQTYFGHP
ncbi:osteocalcin-like [Hyperolius riggenbachi]|uniref:osteocalcin-like n=1 Tax=Hyperolius riggenbachi TaxID=752182 RepID=UPI0035A2B331